MPNRIAFGAHVTNFESGNRFGDRHRQYYLARAKGGAGLLVTEAMSVHPLDQPYEHIPFGHTDAIVPALSALNSSLREAAPEMLVLAGLTHSGGQSSGKALRQSPWAPSSFAEVASKKMSRAMDGGQIAAVIDGFAAAAERARRAGLDGVELNAGQSSLLRQFLSPLTNFRDDEFGGPLENRARVLLRAVAAARIALGKGGVLGVRLCGDELAPWGGLTVDDAVAIARLLAQQEAPDYLSIQIGGPFSVHMTEAAMPVPQGHALHLAARVKEALDGQIPVFAEGRIEAPPVAEAALNEQKADAVVMTRALISDPDLPRKAAGLDAEPLRPHIAMTRYFSVQGDWNRPVGDLANPRAGREARLPGLAPVARPGPMLVVGGGPAGLEAAATLARIGHRVTLMEAGSGLGGMASLLARTVAARAELAGLIAYYRALLERLGVQVELNRRCEGSEASLRNYEAVYLATGAQPPAPPSQLSGVAVYSPRDLLAAEPGSLPHKHGAAVVADREYGFRMAAAVEFLLAGGYSVDVVTPDFLVGRELVESAEFLWFDRVAGQGVRFHPRLEAHRAGRHRLTCRDRFSGRESTLGPLDLVVAAEPEVSAPSLLKALRGRHGRVVAIGDARAPRLMGEAIAHAHRTVLEDNDPAVR